MKFGMYNRFAKFQDEEISAIKRAFITAQKYMIRYENYTDEEMDILVRLTEEVKESLDIRKQIDEDIEKRSFRIQNTSSNET